MQSSLTAPRDCSWHKASAFSSAAKPSGARRCHAAPARQLVTCQAAPEKESMASSLARGAAAAALAAAVTLGGYTMPEQLAPAAHAGMLSKDPVKNARALLRNALPIDNKAIRAIQMELEKISEELRVPGNKPLGSIERAVRKAQSTLGKEKARIVADMADDKRDAGAAALDKLEVCLREFQELLAAQDKQSIPLKQREALQFVSTAEEAMVRGFPFEVPPAYAKLPQLKGRATVDMVIKFKEAREDGVRDADFRIVVDGFNAPVTAGNFIDLVSKGFYNNTEVQRADGFVVQFGDPKGAGGVDGYVDPGTGEVRRVPFEVMVQGDKVPVYEETLEDNGRFNEQPTLPFNAFGTMAMARGEFDTNSASSQVFFLLKESELTPTGSNLLDGRYAVFGYIVDNETLLKDLRVGDRIVEVKVVDGLQNLQQPK